MRSSLIILFWVLTCCISCFSKCYAQKIVLQKNAERLILSNPINGEVFAKFPIPFLVAETHREKIKSKFGSYRFRTQRKRRLVGQTVERSLQNADTLTITGKLFGDGKSCDYTFKIWTKEADRLDFTIELADTTINRLTLIFFTAKNEHFYGFGEQASYPDRKGKKFTMLVEEQGVGRGDLPLSWLTGLVGAAGNPYTSYAPIPFFLTNFQRAFYIRGFAPLTFDFRKDSLARITIWASEMSGTIWRATEPLQLIEKFTAETGRFAALPDWAYGVWLGIQGGAAKADHAIKDLTAAGVPITALWIQDWVGRRKTSFGSRLWWKWLPDSTLYPNLKDYCLQKNYQGIKVLGYINPFLATEGSLYETALANDYLVRKENTEVYIVPAGGFDAAMVDLSKPAAVDWLQGIIQQNLIEQGFSGWMADFAEWFPFDAKTNNKIPPAHYHNQYAVDWAKINRRAIQAVGKEQEVIFFSRSAYSGSAKSLRLLWAGDQVTGWGKHDGLPSALTSLLTGGISGFALNHSDIGGYTNVPFRRRTEELFARWSELAAFTPVFRTHEGLKPNKNVQPYTSEKAKRIFTAMAQLHFTLKAYFKHCVLEAEAKGYPVLRPLFLTAPHDAQCWKIWDSFTVGNDLMVAPALAPNLKKRKVYLPAGTWEFVWTGSRFEGGQYYSFPAEVGKPIAFIRVGTAWTDRLRIAFKVLK